MKRPVDQDIEAIAREATACWLEASGLAASADSVRAGNGPITGAANGDAKAVYALARSVAYQTKALMLERKE